MLYKLSFVATTILFIASCSVSPSYDVYINNQTDEDLIVSYKSDIDKEGPTMKEITIKANQRSLLISTTDIQENHNGHTSPSDCTLVADYLNIYDNKGNKSTISWCTDAIQFAVVDVGQGEFTVNVDDNSF